MLKKCKNYNKKKNSNLLIPRLKQLKKMSAEPKRVSFMTIDTSSDFLKKPEKDTTAGNTKNKSFRLDLEIFEPDEYKFPEFNYKKLIYIEKV